MKKIVAIGLLCMVSAQIGAGPFDDRSSDENEVQEMPELKKMQELKDRNFFSLGAEAAAKSTAKGLVNVGINTGVGVSGAIVAGVSPAALLVGKPKKAVVGVGTGVGVTTASTLKTAFKPLTQLYRAGKTMYLAHADSDSAATREVEKIYSGMTGSLTQEKMLNQASEKSKMAGTVNNVARSMPIFGRKRNNNYYGEMETTLQDRGLTSEQNVKLKKAQIAAAKNVHDQASLAVKLFKRNQLKLAMKEAIRNATDKHIQQLTSSAGATKVSDFAKDSHSETPIAQPNNSVAETAQPVPKDTAQDQSYAKAQDHVSPASKSVSLSNAHATQRVVSELALRSRSSVQSVETLKSLEQQLRAVEDQLLDEKNSLSYPLLSLQSLDLQRKIAAAKEAQSASAPTQKSTGFQPVTPAIPTPTVAQDAINPAVESQASPVEVLNKLSPTEGIPSDPGVASAIQQLAQSAISEANSAKQANISTVQ